MGSSTVKVQDGKTFCSLDDAHTIETKQEAKMEFLIPGIPLDKEGVRDLPTSLGEGNSAGEKISGQVVFSCHRCSNQKKKIELLLRHMDYILFFCLEDKEFVIEKESIDVTNVGGVFQVQHKEHPHRMIQIGRKGFKEECEELRKTIERVITVLKESSTPSSLLAPGPSPGYTREFEAQERMHRQMKISQQMPLGAAPNSSTAHKIAPESVKMELPQIGVTKEEPDLYLPVNEEEMFEVSEEKKVPLCPIGSLRKKKGSRSRKHRCPYCPKVLFKIGRHLRRNHANEEKVKELIAAPDQETRKALAKYLTRQGDFRHNISVLENKEGKLIPVRNTKKSELQDFEPCPSCMGFFSVTNLARHKKTCDLSGQITSKKGIHRKINVSQLQMALVAAPSSSTAYKEGGLPVNGEDKEQCGLPLTPLRLELTLPSLPDPGADDATIAPDSVMTVLPLVKEEPDSYSPVLVNEERFEVTKEKKVPLCPLGKKKGSRSRKHRCPYCPKVLFKIGRHLRRNHANEAIVKELIAAPDKETRKAVAKYLTRQGDFRHNMSVLENKEGKLIPVRNSKRTAKKTELQDFEPCPSCKGFYSATYLARHKKTCGLRRQITTKKKASSSGKQHETLNPD